MPYYRVKGYVNSARNDGDTLDSSYFDGGANQPAGTTEQAWTRLADGPGGSFLLQGSVNWALWGAIGITNTTGAAVTFNWSVPYEDDYVKIVFDGTTEFSKTVTDSGSTNNSGTITVPANSSKELDLFYFNRQGAGVTDASNPGIFAVLIDAFEHAGLQFYDTLLGPGSGMYAGTVASDGTPGPAGPTGATGATGAAGARGSLWYEGSGAPGTIQLLANDLYLNTATGDVYQYTTVWGSPVSNIKGATGATGDRCDRANWPDRAIWIKRHELGQNGTGGSLWGHRIGSTGTISRAIVR